MDQPDGNGVPAPGETVNTSNSPTPSAVSSSIDSDANAPGASAAMPALPFPAEHIDIAVNVLQTLVADDALYNSKACRQLRKVLAPLYQKRSSEMFGGMDSDTYSKLKQKKLADQIQKNRERNNDKSFLAKTQLRAGRMQRLQSLLQQDGAAGVPLILDGVAEDGTAVNATNLGLLQDQSATGNDGSGSTGSMDESDMPVSSSAADQPPEQAATSGTASSAAAGASDAGQRAAAEGETEGDESGVRPTLLNYPRACYTCKRRFRELHSFYDTLCPTCASLNWKKRVQTVDLSGRVVLVTGARVKIGFQCCLKLLRCGAAVIATTRFPHDAAERFASQPDYGTWCDRIHVYGLDMRDLGSLEAFCAMVSRDYSRLDAIVNNACQTVRRPPAYYAPMMEKERQPLAALPDAVRRAVERDHAHHEQVKAWVTSSSSGGQGRLTDRDGHSSDPASSAASDLTSIAQHEADASTTAPPPSSSSAPSSALTAASSSSGSVPVSALPSAEQSQLHVAPGDENHDTALFPTGLHDVNRQQIDLRRHNSWLLRMHEVSTPELVEVFAINAAAPFIINARLKQLMTRGNEDVVGKPGCSGAYAGTGGGETGGTGPSDNQHSQQQQGDEDGENESAGQASSAASTAGLSLAEQLLASSSQVASSSSGSKIGGTTRGVAVGGAAKRPRRDVGGGSLQGETSSSHRVAAQRCRFIVNVSAMEGKVSLAV